MTPEERFDHLEQKLWRLEHELERYHDHLEESLDLNTEFQLKATWGVVQGIFTAVSFVGILHFGPGWWEKLLGSKPGFWGEAVIGIAAFIGSALLGMWAYDGIKGDLKKLYRWPTWRK